MKVAGSIALVTGANRGLGLAFARVLKEMGAAKVYAAARNPEAVTLDGVVPLKLDVTSDEDAAAAASAATDVNLLVNNAGIARPGGFLTDGAVEAAREQFEVNFVGPLRMARAFAPVLAKNGGGAIINVLSVASWMNGPGLATYGASKSAAWALTNGLRIELAQQGTRWIPTRSATPSTALVPQRKVGFPIPNTGLLLGFQGTKTARREGISSPFSDAGGCTSRQNSGSPGVRSLNAAENRCIARSGHGA